MLEFKHGANGSPVYEEAQVGPLMDQAPVEIEEPKPELPKVCGIP